MHHTCNAVNETKFVTVTQNFGLAAVKHENLGNTLYAQLCEALIEGRFPPNHRLIIRDLAESLGTSVTPVRDALLRLIQDGALIQKTPRDVRVPILSAGRYEEIRAIRVRLEGLAARACASKATAVDINRLVELNDRQQAANAVRDWSTAISLNQQFHFALAEIGQMDILRDTLQRLWLQMGPLIAAYYQAGGGTYADQHQAIIEAVRAGDPDAAEDAIGEDIRAAGSTIRAQIARLEWEARKGDDSRRR